MKSSKCEFLPSKNEIICRTFHQMTEVHQKVSFEIVAHVTDAFGYMLTHIAQWGKNIAEKPHNNEYKNEIVADVKNRIYILCRKVVWVQCNHSSVVREDVDANINYLYEQRIKFKSDVMKLTSYPQAVPHILWILQIILDNIDMRIQSDENIIQSWKVARRNDQKCVVM